MRTLSTTPDAFTPDDWAQALVAGPAFDLPDMTALQDELAWHLVKYLREDAALASDVEIEAGSAPAFGPAFFTLDLLVTAPGADGATRRVAFEVGASRTPRDHRRRLGRDATLIACGGADAVYRLRGADLWHRMDDVLFLASCWDPGLFSERGRINLRTLASPEARACAVHPRVPVLSFSYGDIADRLDEAPTQILWHAANGTTPTLHMRRLDARFPEAWREYADSPLRRVEAAPLRRAG